jgi:hypothetical protein
VALLPYVIGDFTVLSQIRAWLTTFGYNALKIEKFEELKYDKFQKETPFFMAAQRGYKSVVKVLLKAGANLHFVRPDGATPLFAAAMNGHKEVLEMLYHAGDITK